MHNKNYFKLSTKIPKVYNRWDFFYVGILKRPTYGPHATKVASIIGGFNGVNPYVDLYGVKLNDWNGVNNEFNYLLHDKKVDIINNSYGIPDDLTENWRFNYSSDSKYIDSSARDNPETIFVYSSGNSGYRNDKYKDYFGQYNLSYNSIVVGANNLSLDRAPFSSYKSTINKKINLLANGVNYRTNNEGLGERTSFSAPFISGLLSIHLKKNKHIFDKGKNNIIAISALSSSTYDKDVSNQTKLNDNGSGLFRCLKI